MLGDKPGVAGSPDGWHKVAANGLPRRYVTSIKADPADPTTVYATVAGYSRRWLPVGALGEGVTGADVGSGHVFKSTDGGQNFTDISGNLPDAPAEWTVVRQDQLIVGTDVGVYVSDVNGGNWELLGRGLPNAPTYSLDLQQKGAANTADVLVAATQGRGICKLPLPAVAATTRSVPQSFFGPAARLPGAAGQRRQADAARGGDVHPRRRHQDGVGEGQRAQPAPGVHPPQGAAADRRRVPGLARDHDPRQPPCRAVHEEVDVLHLERDGEPQGQARRRRDLLRALHDEGQGPQRHAAPGGGAQEGALVGAAGVRHARPVRRAGRREVRAARVRRHAQRARC